MAALLLCVAMSAQPQLQRPTLPDMALAKYVAGTRKNVACVVMQESEEPVWEVKHRGAWVGSQVLVKSQTSTYQVRRSCVYSCIEADCRLCEHAMVLLGT